jgi:hypothetical protein
MMTRAAELPPWSVLRMSMQASTLTSGRQNIKFAGLRRRFREFGVIFRDPVLFMSLLFSGLFI